MAKSVLEPYVDQIRTWLQEGKTKYWVCETLAKMGVCTHSTVKKFIRVNSDKYGFPSLYERDQKGVPKRTISSDDFKVITKKEEVVVTKEVIRDLTFDEIMKRDREVQSLRSQNTDLKRKYKAISNNYIELQELYQDSLHLQERMGMNDREIELLGNHGAHKGMTTYLQLSDWHVGELITKGVTQGLNEHNPEISLKRQDILANNAVSCLRGINEISKINTLVVILGGDFINGWIHEENRETNTMSPLEETDFASEGLRNVLEFIFTHSPSNIDEFVVLCCLGNHGRITKRYRFQNARQTNLESMIYRDVRVHFQSNDSVKVVFPEAEVFTINISGQIIRNFHGQQVKYNRGIGGISVSLNKMIGYWDKTIKADFNFMHHYHTSSMPNVNTLMNGCLNGYNGFSQFYGFGYKPAQQSLISYHPDYDWTGHYRIACEV